MQLKKKFNNSHIKLKENKTQRNCNPNKFIHIHASYIYTLNCRTAIRKNKKCDTIKSICKMPHRSKYTHVEVKKLKNMLIN